MAFSNLNGVQYRELRGSPKESYSSDAFKVTRTFETPWEDRWNFIRLMFGNCRRERVAGATDSRGNPLYSVRRTLPDSYRVAFSSNNKNGYRMVAGSIDSIEGIGPPEETINPDGQDSNVAAYEIARITISYDTPTYGIVPDENLASTVEGFPDVVHFNEATLQRYVTRMTQPSAEALTLPAAAYYYVDNPVPAKPVPVLGANAMMVPTQEVHYTWHRVPGRPSAMNNLLGCVNNGLVDNFARGTLLLVAAEYKPYRWVTGQRVCDITYKMKHFSAINPDTGKVYTPQEGGERGHNYFYRYFTSGATQKGHFLITHNGQPLAGVVNPGRPVYQEVDFSVLFNPDLAVNPFVSDDDGLENL